MSHYNDNTNDDDGVGFSLIMKDLLADLAVDEDDANNAATNWLSLDLLEQELKQLESSNLYSNTNDETLLQQNPSYLTSAAGMVVHTQAAAAAQQQQVMQAFHSPMGLISSVPPTSAAVSGTTQDYNGQYDTTNAMDAWSLSLQKFTASSLEADFLSADIARKQQTSSVTAVATAAPVASDVQNFASYNIKEPARVMLAPPPGITPDASQQLISQAAAKLVQQLKGAAVPEKEGQEDDAAASSATTVNEETLLASQLTRNLQLIHEHQELQQVDDEQEEGDDKDRNTSGLQTPPLKIPRPIPITPQNSITANSFGSVITSAPTPMPTPVVVKTINETVANVANEVTDANVATHPTTALSSPEVQHQQPPPPFHPPVMPVMAVPLPSTMAWQSPPPSMMMMTTTPPYPPPVPIPPQRPVFANPHPTATPIPAAVLSSKFMTSRDIAFVVHGMLKPILMSENLGTMSTYHLQYWTRHHPVKPPVPTSVAKRAGGIGSGDETKMDVTSMEIQARHVKTKEWASERKVLGSTGKTDVTRPRALIAISSSSIQTDTDESKSDVDGVASMKQQRAALWKSRIYCDQAYQCYTAVIDHRWQGPTSSSTSVQPQLLKLTKCLGISVQTVLVDTMTGTASAPITGTTPVEDEGKQFRNQYSVDGKVLELLFKLTKGKILMARVLEDTLLPPSVVQVLLPVALPILFAAPTNTTDDDAAFADDRVLGAWTVVIDTLPTISSGVLLETVKAIMNLPSKLILSSTDRMQCTHALLQRGALVAGNDPTFAADWQETETQFMNLISNM
jgi:hypothetical protein